jgi:macrolide phosphotransferase
MRETIAANIELVRSDIGIGPKLLDRWQTWLDDEPLWNFSPSLIHGDIHHAHLLVDDNSRITGVLDWTEAEVGDPSVDFIFQLMAFGEGSLKQLVADYEKAGGRTWPGIEDQIKEQLGFFPVKYALFALLSGKDEHIQAAREQLGS